ncbi:hypothetical protein [Thermococcus sp.]|uniref:hypothetical protein n=1 Tax=Thermococcus sp. TaxID=35749 RepID=UPI00260AC0DD|nr:hypothetical protein [Thermococcus sp.]
MGRLLTGSCPSASLPFFSVITIDGEPLFGRVIEGYIEYDECGLEIATGLMQATLCLLSPRMSLNPYCAKCFSSPSKMECEHFLSGRKELLSTAYCVRIGPNHYLFTIENGMLVVYYETEECQTVGDVEAVVPVKKSLRLPFREFAEDVINMAENFWNYLLPNLEDINKFLVSSGCEDWVITREELLKYKSLLATLKSIYLEKTNLG